VGIIRTDTIEGHLLSGHRGCTADFGCRMCHVMKTKYAEASWDVVRTGRTLGREEASRVFAATQLGPSGGEQPVDDVLRSEGLHMRTDIFTKNGLWGSHIYQIPYDVFHAVHAIHTMHSTYNIYNILYNTYNIHNTHPYTSATTQQMHHTHTSYDTCNTHSLAQHTRTGRIRNTHWPRPN
jgi:hypothetical protein